MLDVHLFGQARICVDGEPLKFAKRSVTLPMLAYLVLHRDQPVPREFLAFTLFPDVEEGNALSELRRYLYLVQKALPAAEAPWILSDNETVRWNPRARARIDASEFEKLAAQPNGLRAAVELYYGDLLPEVYDDWVLPERERLRALYLNALSALVVQARSERDYAAAIGYAQRLLTHDPWREDVLRHLLVARYEMGDAAGAVAEFDRFARSAREELHVEPMAETRTLRDAIVSGAPLPSSLDRTSEERRAPFEGLPFWGRDRELARLHHAWERAARSSGATISIEGEPGIGKSRLASEFALAVESEGGRVLAGSTGFPESAPYQCVVDLLRRARPLITGLRNDPLRMGILAQALPELHAHNPNLPKPPAVDPEREQLRLFDAIGTTLAELARTRPMLIVLEDVHWAGHATLELLRSLARRTANCAMLIIMTFRDAEVPPEHPLRALQRDLADERLALRIPLARLQRDDVAQLLAHLPSGHETLDADKLFSHSEGNPLFLNEAIRDSLEFGMRDLAPGGVSRIIERRLERLSREALRIAQAAAVCGNAFDAEVACSAAGKSDAQALAAVAELLDRHIVREAGAGGGFEYAFTHHLIAATLYATIEPAQLPERHGRVATALARVHHARPDRVASEIGRHYAAANKPLQAATWYARAARNAAAMFAHDDAARYATLAIERTVDRSALIDMLLVREEANARFGRRAEQAADLDRLDALNVEGAQRCNILHRRAELLRVLEDRDAERQAIDALRAHAMSIGDLHWQGVADCAAAWLDISIGRYAQAKPSVVAAIELLENAGKAAERADALCALAEIEMSTGDKPAAKDALERAQAIARQAGDGRALVSALMQTVSVELSQQQFERVADYGSQAAALYRSQGDRIGEARALVNVAAASLRLSRWEAARSANMSAAATFELAGDRRGLARVLMNLGMLHGRCGDLEHGRRFYVRAREHQTHLRDDRARCASFLNESFLALWQARPLEAKALALQALEIAGKMNHASFRAQGFANLGAAERDLGELDAAIAHMTEGLSLQLQLQRLPDAVSDLADAALAHAMRGDLQSALELVERLLGIDRAWTESAIYPPHPAWVAARVLHMAGDARASAVLTLASALAASFSASIDVPELRASFERLPFMPEMRNAAKGVWP